MTASKGSEEMVPQADKQAHTEIAERAGHDVSQASDADRKNKTTSDDTVPQADKQAHTDIAQRAGREGTKRR